MAMEVQWLLMPGWITLVRPGTDAAHGMKSGGMMRNTDPAEMLITQEIVPLHSTN